MLAENDPAALLAHRLGVHDLVVAPLDQHAVLMDARLVRERVPSDDRLVGLHHVTGEARHQTRRAGQLARVHARLVLEVVGTRGNRHHHFLERRVPGALAETVDAALDLPRAGEHARQGVGAGQPEVVVAVGGDDHPVAGTWDRVDDVADEIAELLRRREADGVGDVDGGGPGLHRRLEHLAHELDLGAGGVLGRELDVGRVRLGPGDGGGGLLLHDIGSHPEHGLHVDLTGRDEDVDAVALGVPDGFPAAVDVGERGSGQTGDHRPPNRLRDRRHRLEVAVGRDREPTLDDVDPETGELLGDLHLLGNVEADSGRLLAVPQRRVEDPHLVHLGSFRALPSNKKTSPDWRGRGRTPMPARA